MAFQSGSVSFCRFAVTGEAPASATQDLLDKLAEHALRPTEIGVPDEHEYGWCAGRHMLDLAFSFENNVFADCIHFALRIDTHRVPSELRQAYLAIEQESAAASNPSGFISKAQKKDAKDAVRRK